jgi:hypothetical protein
MTLLPVFGRSPLRRTADVPSGTCTTEAPMWTFAATGRNADLNLESRCAGYRRHSA